MPHTHGSAHAPHSTLSSRRDNPNPTSSSPAPIRLLRFPEVRHRTGLSRTTIWRLERRGTFPAHRRISSNAVGWLEADVNTWINTRSESA